VHEGYVYVVLRMIRYDAESGELDAEQVSLILAHDCVVSFQEGKPGTCSRRSGPGSVARKEGSSG